MSDTYAVEPTGNPLKAPAGRIADRRASGKLAKLFQRVA